MDDPKVSSRLSKAQSFLMHLGRQDADAGVDLLSPSITYRVPGTQAISGVFTGRTEVSKHLNTLVEATRGTFDPIQWEDWMEGGQHIAALANVQMQREGRVFDGHVVILFRFDSADQIDEIQLFPDDQEKLNFFFL